MRVSRVELLSLLWRPPHTPPSCHSPAPPPHPSCPRAARPASWSTRRSHPAARAGRAPTTSGCWCPSLFAWSSRLARPANQSLRCSLSSFCSQLYPRHPLLSLSPDRTPHHHSSYIGPPWPWQPPNSICASGHGRCFSLISFLLLQI